MGVALYIVLDNESPGFDIEVDGKAVGKASDKLIEIGAALGLPSIDDFINMSMDEVADMLGEEIPDVEEKWFAAEEGVTYFEKIASHLRAQPTALARSSSVIADIEQFLSVLRQARTIGARWRLSVDI